MHSLGVDVVLGSVTGDPPVPTGSSVRTQLVDLYHNLAWLLRLNPQSELPDRSPSNRSARAAARDFYYDLSRRDTHQLEWPFWLTPSHRGETVHSALARLIDTLPRILAGQAVFRPILVDPADDTLASMSHRSSAAPTLLCSTFVPLWTSPTQHPSLRAAPSGARI